jgi:hypothetical protein
LIEVVAGLILAPLCFLLSNRLFRAWEEIPLSLPIPLSWAQKFPWLSKIPADEAKGGE